MSLKFNKLPSMARAAPPPAPAPKKASSDPSKASSPANVETTFGTPGNSY